jgi:hypothetical protein
MTATIESLETAVYGAYETSVVESESEAIDNIRKSPFHTNKVYCANCSNCKLIPAKAGDEDRYVLRIRCAAGKWKKKLGEEKLYKYCTITRRYLDFCDEYEEMGDTEEFIQELRKNINTKDEIFIMAGDKNS